MTAAYKLAYDASNEAIRKFQTAQALYRSGKIGDDEFLSARSAYNDAMAEYDVAYAAEQSLATESY